MTNLVILTGRLARDPEGRETSGGTSVTGITVVTDRPARDKDGKTYKDENGYTAKDSEFHRVTCFNGLAKTVGQFCTKGQLVSVQGRLHYTQWEDQEGVKRYGCEVLADKIDFLSRGNSRLKSLATTPANGRANTTAISAGSGAWPAARRCARRGSISPRISPG